MTIDEGSRLVGWKAIAAYLGKDVRTVLRWERERGLPIHRPPGRRGQSVYALRDELDRWLLTPRPVVGERAQPVTSRQAAAAPQRLQVHHLWLAAAFMLTVGVIVYAGWPRPAIARIAVEGRAVLAFDSDGREIWAHPIAGDSVTLSGDNGVGRNVYIGDVDGDSTAEALVSILVTTSSPNSVSARLLCFETNGRLRWSREIDDALELDGGRFTAPWPVTDLMVFGDERKTIAAAAHHLTWWPSMVLTLDAATGTPRTRYVHRGWIMRVDVTADSKHVVAAGINNPQEAQAVMVLDSNTLEERFYALLPRPDASAAIQEPLDRQHYWISQTGPPTIRFGHSRSHAPVPETIVELADDLRGLRASQSDSYWAWHRRLEREGRLDHAVRQCPERSAPPFEIRPHHVSQ